MRDLVEFLVRALVDDPEAVSVSELESNGDIVLEVRVAEDDLGRVIGREGRVANAIRTIAKAAATVEGGRVMLLTPSGRQFDETLAQELASEPDLALLCGRYEGVDDRVREHLATDAISIGRFVISGGELAAMVVADALVRKLPGALGAAESAVEESFSEALGGAPEYPHYTRPPTYRGWGVPEVLRSGDHDRVQRWRLDRSRERARS